MNATDTYNEFFEKDIILTKDTRFKNPEIQLVTVLLNGNYRFDFSETMQDISKILPKGELISFLNKHKDKIFKLIY